MCECECVCLGVCVTLYPFRDKNEGPDHAISEIWDVCSHTVTWGLSLSIPSTLRQKNKTKLKTYALQTRNLGMVLNAMMTLDEKSREDGKKARDPIWPNLWPETWDSGNVPCLVHRLSKPELRELPLTPLSSSAPIAIHR